MGSISFSHTATLANVGTSGISLVNGSALSMTLDSVALSSVDPNLIMSEQYSFKKEYQAPQVVSLLPQLLAVFL